MFSPRQCDVKHTQRFRDRLARCVGELRRGEKFQPIIPGKIEEVLVDFIEDMLQTVDSLDRWTPLSDRVTALSDAATIDALARNNTQVA